MKKHFYTDILPHTSINMVLIELDETNMKKSEKEHLATIFYSSIHAAVVDTALTELPEEHKKTFLLHLHTKSHNEVLNFLEEKTQNIEMKILSTVEKVTKDFIQDIREVKKR